MSYSVADWYPASGEAGLDPTRLLDRTRLRVGVVFLHLLLNTPIARVTLSTIVMLFSGHV